MPAFEEAIRKSRKKNFSGLKRLGNCPAESNLARYLEGSLPAAQGEDIERHLADCSYCLDLLVVAKEVLKKESPAKVSLLAKLRKQKWLILTAISFAFSFLIRRFFLQFLFLSLILGIKWALSSEGSKNLVMIFRSLSHRQENSSRPEESDEKIFERK